MTQPDLAAQGRWIELPALHVGTTREICVPAAGEFQVWDAGAEPSDAIVGGWDGLSERDDEKLVTYDTTRMRCRIQVPAGKKLWMDSEYAPDLRWLESFRARDLQGLTLLGLEGEMIEIGEEEARIVARQKQLELLDIRSAVFKSEHVAEIILGAGSLKTLWLRSDSFSSAGWRILGGQAGLKCVRLAVWEWRTTDTTRAAFAALATLNDLRNLAINSDCVPEPEIADDPWWYRDREIWESVSTLPAIEELELIDGAMRADILSALSGQIRLRRLTLVSTLAENIGAAAPYPEPTI